MTDFIIKKFIKNHDNIHDMNVRSAYGKLSGKIGIAANIVLFISKFLIGTISGSISIAADAVNNLSDAASSIISLIGFKMAEKPADEDHPYGHARYEYLSGLTVAVMIIVIGFELFKTSFKKILSPSPVDFSIVTVIVLVISIIIKLWLASFNRTVGKKINSSAIEASAADSRNDVISTSAVLLASVVSYFANIELDGYMGIAVAVFILYSGIGLIKDTLDPLLGKAPDPELVNFIQIKILSYDGVLGTHDLMVHDYGPGRLFASVHVEMAAEEDVIISHEIIDNIEQDFLENDNLNIIIHYDPIVTSDEHTVNIRNWLSENVAKIDPSLSIHDLRMVPGKVQTKLVFDCVVPPSCYLSSKEITSRIRKLVSDRYKNYSCVITIESSFAPMPHTKQNPDSAISQ